MARNCGETQIFYGNCRMPRAKRSFWKLCSSEISKEASHETFVLEALFYEIWRKPRTKRSFWKLCSMKFGGSLARNARFGSLFCEISRKPRTKRLFWKLVLWNFEEASHETLVLEACSVKFRGSLARNARFGSLFCEISRKPRTKRSFWKLCSVKYGGSLARHVRFGSFVLWNMEEASRDTFVLEACSLKFGGSLARNAETLVLEAWFYEI